MRSWFEVRISRLGLFWFDFYISVERLMGLLQIFQEGCRVVVGKSFCVVRALFDDCCHRKVFCFLKIATS
jgi:hypothetical protein